MKYYTTTTEYNCGIDLHSKQMYACILDAKGIYTQVVAASAMLQPDSKALSGG